MAGAISNSNKKKPSDLAFTVMHSRSANSSLSANALPSDIVKENIVVSDVEGKDVLYLRRSLSIGCSLVSALKFSIVVFKSSLLTTLFPLSNIMYIFGWS